MEFQIHRGSVEFLPPAITGERDTYFGSNSHRVCECECERIDFVGDGTGNRGSSDFNAHANTRASGAATKDSRRVDCGGMFVQPIRERQRAKAVTRRVPTTAGARGIETLELDLLEDQCINNHIKFTASFFQFFSF